MRGYDFSIDLTAHVSSGDRAGNGLTKNIVRQIQGFQSEVQGFQRTRVLQVRRLMAYFEMCLSARRRIGSTVSRLRVYSIVFPSLSLVTSPQNARHLRW